MCKNWKYLFNILNTVTEDTSVLKAAGTISPVKKNRDDVMLMDNYLIIITSLTVQSKAEFKLLVCVTRYEHVFRRAVSFSFSGM